MLAGPAVGCWEQQAASRKLAIAPRRPRQAASSAATMTDGEGILLLRGRCTLLRTTQRRVAHGCRPASRSVVPWTLYNLLEFGKERNSRSLCHNQVGSRISVTALAGR